MRPQSALTLCLLLAVTATGLAQDAPPATTGIKSTTSRDPAAPPPSGKKKMGHHANKLIEKMKGRMDDIDWEKGWKNAKEGFWKGLDMMEAVSGKDLNGDGKTEGHSKLTKAEQEAEWKKEHEEKRKEHDKRRADFEARKAAGEDMSNAGAPGAPAGAASRRNSQPLSKDEQKVVGAIRVLLGRKFRNSQEAMFNSFDKDNTNSLDKDEIKNVCYEASVGNMMTRGVYATKLLAKLDTNHDNAVQLSEIEAVMGGNGGSSGDGDTGPGAPVELDQRGNPKPRGVSVDDVREVCADELKLCEDHENGCDEEMKLSLAGQLKGPQSDELKAVIKCYGGRGPGGKKAQANARDQDHDL